MSSDKGSHTTSATLHGESGEELDSLDIGRVVYVLVPICQTILSCIFSANAIVIHDTDEVVVCNGGDSINLHNLKSGNLLRTYKCRAGGNPASWPVQVACTEGGSCIVAGSCYGVVSVFKYATRDLLQELNHSQSGHVQTVTVRKRNDSPISTDVYNPPRPLVTTKSTSSLVVLPEAVKTANELLYG